MIDSPATPRQVAEYLRVSRTKVMAAIDSGELPAVDLSSPGSTRPRYSILPEDLQTFLDRRRVSVSPPRRRRKPVANAELDDIPEYV